MSERDDENADVPEIAPEIVQGAERALTHPAAADLDLLTAVHRGLAAVSSGAGLGMPAQRPPGRGEEGLATRRSR